MTSMPELLAVLPPAVLQGMPTAIMNNEEKLLGEGCFRISTFNNKHSTPEISVNIIIWKDNKKKMSRYVIDARLGCENGRPLEG